MKSSPDRPLPAMPEQVYYLAATIWDRHSARPAYGDIEAPLRAAVESAYRAGIRAGQHDLVERISQLASEQFQAGRPWPAGTVLTAQGIRDMLILLVAEAV